MESNDKTKWINTVLHQMSKIEEIQAITALENCGRECLKSSDSFREIEKLRDEIKDKDNIDLLFDTYKEKIYKNSPCLYKDDTNIYLEYQNCGCGMVTNGGVIDSFLCNCTVGYTKQIFETLFGKPVNVQLLKSILNGDSICKQKISLKLPVRTQSGPGLCCLG
ncbi:MAG: hypothetical protein GY834_13025 [Bacteroidetes bacterium]|nr:hypothetical protein [Bacteroidota bacterium]